MLGGGAIRQVYGDYRKIRPGDGLTTAAGLSILERDVSARHDHHVHDYGCHAKAWRRRWSPRARALNRSTSSTSPDTRRRPGRSAGFFLRRDARSWSAESTSACSVPPAWWASSSWRSSPPSLVPSELARCERALRRATLRRRGALAPPDPAAARHRQSDRRERRARQRARARLLGHGRLGRGRDRAGLREGRPPRGQQLAQPSHRRRRPAAHPRGQRRSPRAHRRAAEGPRLDAARSSPTRTARRWSCRSRSRRSVPSA